MEPAAMTVTLITPPVAPGATGEFTADLSQIASLVNRRFYRQGLNWAVAGIKVLTVAQGNLSVSKLPNTWVTAQAWKKAFDAWNTQQLEAADDAGANSALARFRDFKIHADVSHVTSGFAGNLLPHDDANNPYSVGEWEASLIVLPNQPTAGQIREFLLHMVGANVAGTSPNSRGIIEGYADSRAYPQSPDPVSPNIDSTDNWLAMMVNDSGADPNVLDNATDRNDNLPYPQVNYPGGETQAPTLERHDNAIITPTTIGGTTRLKGGNFPCGLMRIAWNPTLESAGIRLDIDLVPGPHRGYLCESMQEM